MPRATVLTHADHEDAARIGAALAARGFAATTLALHRGDALPADGEVGELLLVMGGPMGVYEADQPRYRFLARELALLRRRIADDLPTLGICLGAQLLAGATGARVYPHHEPGDPERRIREVGYGDVDLLHATGDPALEGLPERIPVLHWHGDTFALPSGATLLASTRACRHQAFRLGRRCYGLQFHVEVEPAQVAVWLREDADYVALANGPGGAARIAADADRLADAVRAHGDRLIANILDAIVG